MALKPDRKIVEEEINFSCVAVTDRGYVLCHSTAGSGAVLGDTAGTVDKFASASGKIPVGILVQDVVSVDQTRYHLNFHKEVVPSGGPVTLIKKGWAHTNAYTGSPTAGATAYLTANGTVTPTLSTTGGLAATPKVGQFRGSPDADGYVCLEVNLPVV